MQADQLKWDARYQDQTYLRQVSETLSHFIVGSGQGCLALDIACGQGQNSLFLAEKEFMVDALDISNIALKQFEHPLIRKQVVDFDHYRFQENHYDLILNFFFLERRLFPYMAGGLKPGGILLFETFLPDEDHGTNPDHKLREQELLYSFLGLKVIYYHETKNRATLIAQRPGKPQPTFLSWG